jgi:hypothetical protein
MVKIVEEGKQESTIISFPGDLSVAQALMSALEKRRCIDAKTLINQRMTQAEKHEFLINEGWSLCDTRGALALDTSFDDVMIAMQQRDTHQAAGLPLLTLCKTKPVTVESFAYDLSAFLTPIDVFKLESKFIVADPGAAIDSEHWQNLHVTLAHGRYLCFFKTLHQSCYLTNCAFQVDLARVTAIDATEVSMLTPDGPKTVLRLSTRTRQLYFATQSNEVQSRFKMELEGCVDRLKNPEKYERPESTNSIAVEVPVVSPGQAILDRMVVTRDMKEMDTSVMSDEQSLVCQVIRDLAIARFNATAPPEAVLALKPFTKPSEGKFTSMLRLFRRNMTLSNTALDEVKLFGAALDALMPNEGKLGLPARLEQCMNHVMQNGLHTPGIFRLAGSMKRIEALRKMLESTEPVAFDGYLVIDVAAVIKQFFRELPESLIPAKLYRTFLAINRTFLIIATIHCRNRVWRGKVGTVPIDNDDVDAEPSSCFDALVERFAQHCKTRPGYNG